MIQNEFTFRHSTLWTENGILFGKYAKDVIIDLSLAKEIVADRKRAFGNIYWPMFVDASELLSIDREARHYMSGEEANAFINAGALYANNKVSEIIESAWVILDKPIIPTMIFDNKESALKWLEPYVYEAALLNRRFGT